MRINFYKRLMGVVLFFLSLSFSAYGQCPNLVWADEFNGTSLDLTKWNYQTGDGCAEGICGWGNGELQNYQEANVTVSNGTLKITAQEQRIKGTRYTSGRITSKNKGDFTYGRFEASIKMPAGNGLWPAFWMLSTNEPYGIWPQSGEIDIVELISAKPDSIFGTIHYGVDGGPQNQGNDYVLSNGDFTTDFHEFAIEWEPGEIRWYVDGIHYSTKVTSDVSPFNWPFDNDFHFLLNVAVGGTLGGTVDNNALPSSMEVDYVRVYDGNRASLNGDLVVLNQAQNQVYTIESVAANTNVTWSVPAGATIVSGQGTPTLTVNFGSASGNLSASFDPGCGAEVITAHIEVEPPFTKEFSFENFDDPATVTLNSANGTLTEVANPAPDAVNGSALSGQYVRNSAEQFDNITYNVSNITNAADYVFKRKKFYLDVYTTAPVGTAVLVQLESSQANSGNFPDYRHSRYVATTTTTGAWERLIFDFVDRPDPNLSDGAIAKMVVLFASNTFTGDTYYFDNLDSYQEDMGGGSNQSPTVSISSPGDGSSFDEGTVITVEANASDVDGSVSSVEFFADGNSIGTDNTSPYSVSWTVPLGTTSLTAVATDNENASTTSAGVSVTGQATGSATDALVNSVVTGTVGAGRGQKFGRATVTILDNLGNPVANAQVSGTFSGTFNESASGTTDGSGVVVLQTQNTASGGVTVNFCIDNVVAAGLTYNSATDPFACGTGSNQGGFNLNNADLTLITADKKVSFYPNPAENEIVVNAPSLTDQALLKIMGGNGQQFISQRLKTGENRIDISQLPSGFYLIQVTDTGLRQVLKLMK